VLSVILRTATLMKKGDIHFPCSVPHLVPHIVSFKCQTVLHIAIETWQM
jgi:hypothetical protein